MSAVNKLFGCVNMCTVGQIQKTEFSIDLHVHTPESTCYGEARVSWELIVDAAMTVGLDGIAITDHNTVAAIPSVRSAAAERGLLVFPGVEVSTALGHVLCIFDGDAGTDVIEQMLAKIGVLPEWRGDGTKMTEVGMQDVVRVVAEAGGLAIPAHVDRWPSGLLHSSASLKDKIGVINSEYISAIEITVPGDKVLWNTGRFRNFPRKLACIQGSDAHSTGEIGRRSITVGMKGISLTRLREAMLNIETGVVFS